MNNPDTEVINTNIDNCEECKAGNCEIHQEKTTPVGENKEDIQVKEATSETKTDNTAEFIRQQVELNQRLLDKINDLENKHKLELETIKKQNDSFRTQLDAATGKGKPLCKITDKFDYGKAFANLYYQETEGEYARIKETLDQLDYLIDG